MKQITISLLKTGTLFHLRENHELETGMGDKNNSQIAAGTVMRKYSTPSRRGSFVIVSCEKRWFSLRLSVEAVAGRP